MSKLTEKQYKLLDSKYKVAIIWAVKSNCVPAFTRADLNELESIYNSLGYKLDTRSCGHCILSMVQTIGKAYYSYEPEIKEEKEEEYEREQNSEPTIDTVREDEEPEVSERICDPRGDGAETGRETKSKKRGPRRKRKVVA